LSDRLYNALLNPFNVNRSTPKETSMLKKARAEASAGGDDTLKQMSQSVLSSSRQIWLAGLGAFSRAQKEGGKVFDALVQQGQELEARTKTAASGTADAAREAALAKAKEMQTAASGTWDKLEQVFEDRVAKALARLGFHSAADLERLVQRVDALSQSVNALLAAGDAAPGQQVGRVRKNSPRSNSNTSARRGVADANPPASGASVARKRASKPSGGAAKAAAPRSAKRAKNTRGS
jgi:poly(hydroxyalkanoate) granule-associated protein